MLEKQGFKHHRHVDPFDGGPYLDTAIGDIPLVKATCTRRIAAAKTVESSSEAFVSYKGRGGFRATRTRYDLAGERVTLPSATLAAIGAPADAVVGFTPLPESKPTKRRGAKKD